MNVTQPHYPHLPASSPGHRLGTLSFRTDASSFVFMLHEGAWQGSIVYTGYATPRGEAGPVTLVGFTATIPSFSVFRKIRPELLPTKMNLAFEIPNLNDPAGAPEQVSITSIHAISPYQSEDGRSFDSLTVTLSLDDGTVIADGEITGFARGVAATTVVIGAVIVVGFIGGVAWFFHSEDNRHEEAMKALEIAEELAKLGHKVELKIDAEHGASGSGGPGQGAGSASLSAGITLTISPPSNPTPPAGGG